MKTIPSAGDEKVLSDWFSQVSLVINKHKNPIHYFCDNKCKEINVNIQMDVPTWMIITF